MYGMAGADVNNGLWAIYGAREGLHKTMCTDWDYVNVRDFEHSANFWKEKIQTEDDLLDACIDYGERILAEIDLPIVVTLSPVNFKQTYLNSRSNIPIYVQIQRSLVVLPPTLLLLKTEYA